MRIAGLILAGGEGRRMGADKALLPLAGKPLIEHVIERLAPQLDCLAISANGDPERFDDYGVPVLPDLPGEAGQGPVAGLRAGLAWAEEEEADVLVTVATDTPFLPADLVERLVAPDDLAYATHAGRAHYTAALWPLTMGFVVDALYATGERRLRALLDGAVAVKFPGAEDPFANLNTAEDLAAAEARLAARPGAR